MSRETDRPPLPDPETFGACYDCGRHYGDEYGFPDLVLPNDVWAKISPRGDEGGLLCPSCICRRAHALGMSDVPAMWASGPLKSEPYTPAERHCDHGLAEWKIEDERAYCPCGAVLTEQELQSAIFRGACKVWDADPAPDREALRERIVDIIQHEVEGAWGAADRILDLLAA
jgi:hypothetical protein